MIDSRYRKRLAADLPAWRERGWVSAEGAAAILSSLDGRRSTFGMAAIAGTLGALLLGLGVIAFVSANWQEIPRLLRFGVLVAAMGAAYAVAAVLQLRGLRLFADAALLVAGLVFAAAIALVGQSYHLSGEFADAVFLFIVGVLGAACLTGSTTLTVVALAAGAYWTSMIAIDAGLAPHWGGLAVVVAGGAVATWLNTDFGRVTAILAFAYWVTVNLIVVAGQEHWSFGGTFAVVTSIAVLAWATGAALATLGDLDRLAGLGRALLVLGLIGVLGSLGVLQVAPMMADWGGGGGWVWLAAGFTVAAAAVAAFAWFRGRLSLIDVLAVAAFGALAIAFALVEAEDTLPVRLAGGVVVIAAAVWAINLGQTAHVRGAKGLGLTAFGLEVVYLYGVTLGTLIDTALAFLAGGVLFVVLAWALYRIDRRLAVADAGKTP